MILLRNNISISYSNIIKYSLRNSNRLNKKKNYLKISREAPYF